jgi:hypothetical protein
MCPYVFVYVSLSCEFWGLALSSGSASVKLRAKLACLGAVVQSLLEALQIHCFGNDNHLQVALKMYKAAPANNPAVMFAMALCMCGCGGVCPCDAVIWASPRQSLSLLGPVPLCRCAVPLITTTPPPGTY